MDKIYGMPPKGGYTCVCKKCGLDFLGEKGQLYCYSCQKEIDRNDELESLKKENEKLKLENDDLKALLRGFTVCVQGLL